MTTVDERSISLLDYDVYTNAFAGQQTQIDFDPKSYAQFGNIGTFTILSDNPDYPLRLTGIADVEVEARKNINMFVSAVGPPGDDIPTVNLYTTSYDPDNNSRIDKIYMSFQPEEAINVITLKPEANLYSTLQVQYPIMKFGSDIADELYVNAKAEFTNTATFAELYSPDLRVFKKDGDNFFGYVFEINAANRLELLKVHKTGSDVFTTTVATFGYGDVPTNEVSSFGFSPGAASSNSALGGSTSGPTSTINATVLPADDTINIGSYDNPINHIYARNFHTVSAGGADFAERIEKENYDDVFKTGEIVGISAEGKLTKKFSKSIHFGIVSDSGAIIAHAGLTEENSEIIAFSGRVPVDTNGEAGDYLVPSLSIGDSISCQAKKEVGMTLPQYMKAIGHVISMTADGKPYVVVKH